MIVNIIGWTALIVSWILPHLMENKEKATFIAMGLAAFSCGLFFGALITKYYSL